MHSPHPLTQSSAPSIPKRIQDIPFPKGIPVLGNLHQIKRAHLHLQLQNWCDQFGPVYSYRLGPSTIFVISDLPQVQDMLKRRPHDFRRTSKIEILFQELGVHGVFSAEGENWRRQRRLIMPAFHQGNLIQFFDTLCTITRRLKNRWIAEANRGEDIEICKDLTRFTVDVTSLLAFDYDMNTLEKGEDVIQNHLEHMFPAIDRRISSLFPYWRYITLPKDRRLNQALKAIQNEIGKIIETTEKKLATQEAFEAKNRTGNQKNLLESLILSKDKDGTGFSKEEILGNVFTILVAGEDTTATSLAWTLSYMMDHPDIQNRMQEEAKSVLKESDQLLNYEDSNRLKYIEAVILEALRLKPVAPFLFLQSCHDLELGGLLYPKGTLFTTMLCYPAFQEENFTHAREFRPERWIEEERPSHWNHEPKAFMTFGGGARICPGRTLALLEMKSVLAMFCKNFSVQSPKNDSRLKEEFRFSLSPVDFWIQIEHQTPYQRPASPPIQVDMTHS